MRPIAAALASLVLTAPALAQAPPPPASGPATPAAPPPAFNVRTTQDLVDLCNTPDGDPAYPGRIGLCVGYGSGILDFYLADTAGRRRMRKICIPNPAPTRGEARRMFIAWAQQNSTYADEPAVQGVMRFFITTFPCKK